jgi:hypothetical protein
MDEKMVTDTQEEITQLNIEIPKPHSDGQDEFVRCAILRQVIKAGRRYGKTYSSAIKACLAFLGICSECMGEGCVACEFTGKIPPKRVLYAAPTAEQVGKFWFEIVSTLSPGIDIGYFKKDETEHVIEIPRTETRIKAKTAWNANTLRGDYADLLIMEEYQMMNEDAWEEVGQPMLLDNNGTAVFIFTPPSLKSEGVSKAKDPRHVSKMFKKAALDTTGRWKTFHFTSYDNPTLSQDALSEISKDMSADSYRREILAEDDEVEMSWLVYGKFNDDLCKIKRFEIPDNWPVFSGHDFGVANPAALFVAQVKLPLPPNAPPYMRYGDYVAFAEYAPGAGYSAEQHRDRFKEVLGNRKLERAVGGNVTTEEEIRQLYRKIGWFIHAPEITRVNLQIDRAMSIVENNQLYVFEDLHQLLHQLHDCMWVLDEQKKPTNKIKDEAKWHIAACLRYLATTLVVKQVYGEKKAQVWKW